MNAPDILFQFSSTDASTGLTDGHLAYVAPLGGQTMINQIVACPSAGGAANFYRIYHAGPDESPAAANMIFFGGADSTAKDARHTILDTKIVMQPGDKLFCQLHSGDGITISAYGIVPINYALDTPVMASQEIRENPLPGHELIEETGLPENRDIAGFETRQY